jgi:hypothetical protein
VPDAENGHRHDDIANVRHKAELFFGRLPGKFVRRAPRIEPPANIRIRNNATGRDSRPRISNGAALRIAFGVMIGTLRFKHGHRFQDGNHDGR